SVFRISLSDTAAALVTPAEVRTTCNAWPRLRLPSGIWTEKRASAPAATRAAVSASASPAAATIMIANVMIAVTHGVGPFSRRGRRSGRSDGDVNNQANIRTDPPVGAPAGS